MGVQDPPRIGLEDRPPENRPEAGHGDELDPVGSECCHDFGRVAVAVEARSERRALDPHDRDASPPGDAFRLADAVDEHDRDGQPRTRESREDCARAGCQDGYPSGTVPVGGG